LIFEQKGRELLLLMTTNLLSLSTIHAHDNIVQQSDVQLLTEVQQLCCLFHLHGQLLAAQFDNKSTNPAQASGKLLQNPAEIK